MKIGVIGAGRIGGTLARKWSAAGHELMGCSRDPNSPRAQALLKDVGGKARLGSLEETAAFGEVVVFAIPGGEMPETVKLLGAQLDGKLVIDATNAVGRPVMNSIDAIMTAAPRAQVYRAFNSLPWEDFANPTFGDTVADLFYCGPAANQKVLDQLIRDVGLEAQYVGDATRAGLIDAVAGLFFSLSQRLGREIAFKVLKR
jgi:predicted dinucleotide-binding enzyme